MGFFGSGKEMKCKKCGTTLSDPERLKRHQEKAHNKKNERCRTCGSEFQTSDELKRHRRRCK